MSLFLKCEKCEKISRVSPDEFIPYESRLHCPNKDCGHEQLFNEESLFVSQPSGG